MAGNNKTVANLGAFFNEEETLLDNECVDIVDQNLNMSVPWFLMSAYAYYRQDDPILSDVCFDKLSKKMLTQWDEITHQHKECITKDDLSAGTFLGKYPPRVEGGLKSLREVYHGKKTNSSRNHS